MLNAANLSLREQEIAARLQIEKGSLYKTQCDEASLTAKQAIREAIAESGVEFCDFDGDEDVRFLLAVDEETGMRWREMWFKKIQQKDEWMSLTYKTIGAYFSAALYDEIKQLPNHTDLKLLENLVKKRTMPLLTKLQAKYGQLEMRHI